MRFLTVALFCVVGCCLLAPKAVALEDELDHGVFKYLYTKETRRMYYDPVPLGNILKNPKHYLNSYVTVKARFHRLEEDLAVPEFTPFSPQSYMAFSVWDISARLWAREDMTSDYPLFFIERGTDEAQKLLRAKRFDVIMLYCKVQTLFADKPWFVVSNVKFLVKGELNLTLFTHIELAEEMARRNQHDLAVEELRRCLEYDANKELRSMLYKRLGSSYIAIGKYAEAARAMENSYGAKIGDPEVYALWADSVMALGRYKEAINLYNLSLKYKGKQAVIYAKIGWCYAKVADEKINSIRSGATIRKGKKPEEVRRREKKVRGEYSPERMGQFAERRAQLTLNVKDEILALYDQAIRECRKSLFVNPNLPDRINHLNDVKSKKAQFVAWVEKEFGTPAEAPAEAPAKK